MRYEIYNSRFDVSESLYASFNVDSEEEAIDRLKEIANRPSMAWDSLRMIEVVVERKTRSVATFTRKAGEGVLEITPKKE